LRLERDASVVREEVLQHLTRLVGADVTVTLEIHASLPDGVPGEVERTVKENSRTLHFEHVSFEAD